MRLSPDAAALLVVGLAVVVANLPALLGFFHLDPLGYHAGLTGALTPGLLGGKPTIDPSNGFTSQAIGHLAAHDLLHLHWPWWNPYEGTGMPLLGETQSAGLFPLTLLTAIPDGQLYEHVLLELIAGVCTYRLLRRVGLARAACVAGGVAFALNGKFAWFADATVNPLAFLPMLLLGIERAFAAAREHRRNGWRLIALAAALTAYAGFPEVAYADVLMAVVWVIWRSGCLRGADLGRFALRIALGALVGVILAAPMLVAMADALSHADLASHVGTLLGGRHLPATQLPELLMPYVYGPINVAHDHLWTMIGGYLSIVLLLFAAVALITPGRYGLKCVLVAWGLLVFSHMYGIPPVIGDALRAVPEMSRIQFYRYATAALELPVIILAALGLDALTRAPAHRWRLVSVAILAVALVAVGAGAAHPVLETIQATVQHAHDFFTASIVWAVATSVAVGVIAFVRRDRLRAGLLMGVVVVDAIALFAVPQFSAPRAARTDLAPVAYLHRHLGEGRFFTLGPIQPNYGSYFGLASLRIDDFPPNSFARFYHARLNPSARFVGFQPPGAPSATQELLRHIDGYRAAGVRYVLTRPNDPLPSSHHAFRLVFHDSTALIYRLTGSTPYFHARGCRVSSTQRDSASVSCRHATTLVRHETWFAGWTARIDGRPVAIHRHEGVFQAVRVLAGRHHVTFSFVPVGMRWALLGLLAGCVLMIVPTAWSAVAWAWRRATAGRDSVTA